MGGDWQTVKVTRLERPPSQDIDPDSKEAVAFGIRKRKFEDQEEEEAILGTGDASAPRKNRAWGARMKTFPGSNRNEEGDLDALLGGVTVKRKAGDADADEGESVPVKEEEEVPQDEAVGEGDPQLKKSDSHEEQEAAKKLQTLPPDPVVKTEDTVEEKPVTPAPGTGIVFKKRKKIAR